MKQVYLVVFAGGIIGIFDNQDAADQVAKARNDYAQSRHGRAALKATVQEWEVQSTPDPRDL